MFSAARQFARNVSPVASQLKMLPRASNPATTPIWADLCPRGFSCRSGVREIATTSQTPMAGHLSKVALRITPQPFTTSAAFSTLRVPPRVVGLQSQASSAGRVMLRGFASEASSSAGATAAAEPKMGKFKLLWKTYGWTAIGTYLGVYLTTLGSIYVLVYNGFMQPKSFSDEEDHANPHIWRERVDGWLKTYLGLDLGLDRINPKTSTFITAWFATKLTEPARFVISAMLTPRIARMLGKVPKV
mmetsp:Transcript_44378/g.73976  ORF Transcript_44378/g.73976 Transcript_44378/m.73976 type:complete len:245 (+) Transcript_44378:267-1001(+)